VLREPAGVIDLLPTVCGLIDIDKPEGVHLDGSDLSPLLTGPTDEFTRHQPLYWYQTRSVAIRDGNYSMVASGNYQFPRDQKAIAAKDKEISEYLRQTNSPNLIDWISRTGGAGGKVFQDQEAERLRIQFLKMNMFQESWISVIKSGTYKRFELYDLSTDPEQKRELSVQFPDVADRMKNELLEITASVMSDGLDWK